MASTNKTPHLGLCQWEATDPFLREDMNGDFARIDEAFGNLPRQKLFDVTFDGTVSMVQLDCSEIDMEQFAELEIFCDFGSGRRYMRINEIAASNYFNGTSGSGSYASSLTLDTGKNRLLIFKEQFMHRYENVDYKDYLKRTYAPTLNSLEFFGSVNYPFVKGDRISVWGVRR